MLSKYTAILFPGALLLFLLLRRRDVLKRRDSWLAMLAGALIFSPVLLLWNSEHHWISFAFQYEHGTSRDALCAGAMVRIPGRDRDDRFANRVRVCTAAAFARHTRRDGQTLYLAAFFILPLAFFAWKGLFHKMELNWAAGVSSRHGADGRIHRQTPRPGQTFMAAMAGALLLTLAIRFPVAMGLPAKWNPLNRFYANREAVQALLELRRPGEPLLADHYTTASLLGFYAADHPTVRIATPSRFSQYDLWAAGQLQSTPRGLYLAGAGHGRCAGAGMRQRACC